MKLAELPIDRPVGTVMLLLSFMVLGAVAMVRLPLDFMPMIKEPEVDIEVPFPGSHPLETLQEVAIPIEEEVATIPDVKNIRAWASRGQARLQVRFAWSADIDIKRLEVREAVERARPFLPEGIGQIKVEGDIQGPADGAILQGRISAERNLSESWDLLDKRIKRPLERIKGVASIDLYGVEPSQVRIDIDLDTLKKYGLNAGDIIDRINAANLDMDLGSIRGDVVRYDVRSTARFQNVDTIASLPIGEQGLRIRDVAEVTQREPVLDYGRHLDRKFAIGIDVFREPTANTVETVDRIIARIEEIEKDPELKGINLLVWSNAGEEIRNSLSGLLQAGVYGGILAIVILFAFLRKFSTTAIVAVAIPFSIVVTCGMMYALGSVLDVLTMLGLMLGIGMLVDNAVVVMENIYRLQGLGYSTRRAAREGVKQVALPVMASTATTVIVWSWLWFTERGPLSIYLGSVATVICLSVACSLLVSLTFIPLAASRWGPKGEVKPGFLMRWLVPRYQNVLRWTLKHRTLTLILLISLAGSAAYPIANIEKSGEPKERQNAVQINYQVHDPSTKEVLETFVNQVEEWLANNRDKFEYESLYSWYSENRGVMTRLYLPPDQANEKGIKELRQKLEPELPTIPGVTLEVGERDWWRRMKNDGSLRVSIALKGEDPEYLEILGRQVESEFENVPLVKEIWGPSLVGQREARIMVDPEKARSFGVTPQQVARAVSFSFRGQRLRSLQAANGEVEVLLGIPEDEQPGMAALQELTITGAEGASVSLSSVATIELARIRDRIERDNRATTQYVSVQFEDGSMTLDEAKAKAAEVMGRLNLPDGYLWDFGEWGRRQEDAIGTMTQGVILSLIIVLLLMAALFESITQPLAILITLPLAFFGAFWGLWIFDYQLDSMAFIGVIILIGIVVNNGIVMVDHVNHLRAEGMDRVEALIDGCGHRFRPVLMTAITTIFGLIPLALSTFTVANVIADPLAVAVLGGLVTSTLFTLMALPVWYTTVEDLGALILRALPLPRKGKSVWRARGGVVMD